MNISDKIFNVRTSYIVIFISLVIWSFFAFFTMTEIINSQKVYGKLINVSGKQRMLSQKTTLIAKRFLETKDQFLFEHLKKLIKKMRNDHHFLINSLNSEHMKNLYFKQPYHIDFQVQSYLNLLHDFIQKQDLQTISQVEQYSFKLLPILDHAVNEFEKESDSQISELQRQEVFILIGTLFTLIIEALFIMIPALKIVKKSREKLLTFNSELQKEVEKKRKEIQLEHENKKVYFNTINSVIVALDIEGNITTVNTKALKILGMQEKDVLGKNWFEIGVIPTDEFHKVKRFFHRVLNGEIDIREKSFESSLLDDDANIKILTWSVAVMKEDGQIRGVLSSGIDITNEKKQEHIIKEQTKLASMGEMIGNIAHQWRQPLSVISTLATGIQVQSELGVLEHKQIINMCDQINGNAQYLSQTIDDFRNFIRGDSKPVNFDLRNDTDSFIKLVDTTIKKYNIQVILDLEEEIHIKGFPNELIQCFINIFNNSKDALLENYIDENERYIFISQHIDKDKVQIVFKDNAGGIPENIIGKVFEAYFTTKDDSHGTGLGLHMTYKLIVNGMGGDIKVENETYRFNEKEYYGAKFIIELPYAT